LQFEKKVDFFFLMY